VVQEFADLLSVMAAAAADSRITQAESKSIRARWENLKSVTEEFVKCCEDGDFRDLKERKG
jgi:predicted transcriptional regulator